MPKRVLALALASGLAASPIAALELEYVSHLKLYQPEIDLTEPSGLALDPDGGAFWIVSDNTPTVFRLDIASGDLSVFHNLGPQVKDLEGVAVAAGSEKLLVVSERAASVVTISISHPHDAATIDLGDLPGSKRIAKHLRDTGNGLEGITVDPETGSVFLIKEDKPSLLIEMTPELDRVVKTRDLSKVLPHKEDVSGLAFDSRRNGLWIVSDTGKSVHFLANDSKEIISNELTWRDGDRIHHLDNTEGVALSLNGTSLFVLNDDGVHSLLVQYNIK
ncbi:SdiA-regulated domain-containing protein [Halocynthiibacter sp. C4]|uniref:SdiA-regulated domain-containing protein n=1 Tax=Halocynthiibacter sp. C4 TaxID=2992758 RepID=UPI00237BB799|nr:SdiA-regulated domain-containing protein [Halocynthiibacter sp. C4]MDE0588319.1 SdiA-regulated domain-containing protein [Halocynthiibacter sp. C4]